MSRQSSTLEATGDRADGPGDETRQPNGVKGAAQAQAHQVASTAKDETGAVLDTAKQQAQAVAADVRSQTMQLADEARGRLVDHAGTQRDRAVENLRSMGDDFAAMAETSDSSGLAVQLAREGGDVAKRAADFLEQREPGQILDEVRDLARRRPGAFLLGAVVAGLVVGRLTRGVVSAHQDTDDNEPERSLTTAPGVLDRPVSHQPEPLATSAAGDTWGPGAAEYPGVVPAGVTRSGPLP